MHGRPSARHGASLHKMPIDTSAGRRLSQAQTSTPAGTIYHGAVTAAAAPLTADSRWPPARAGAEPGLGARADRLGERGPGRRGEVQLGAAGVLGVTYRDGGGQRRGHLDAVAAVASAVGGLAPHLGDLDAVAAVASAVGGLAPYGAGHVHVLATSCKSSNEAARGRASVFNVS